jgi:hypothetical protein
MSSQVVIFFKKNVRESVVTLSEGGNISYQALYL